MKVMKSEQPTDTKPSLHFICALFSVHINHNVSEFSYILRFSYKGYKEIPILLTPQVELL